MYSLNDLMFQNISEKKLTFEQVFERNVTFIKKDPRGNFRLMLGTDSQVHKRHTIFITGVVIQREGKGAWACIRRVKVLRKMTNLHERISKETSLTEEIAYLFDQTRKDILIDIVLPHIYEGASFTMEGHI